MVNLKKSLIIENNGAVPFVDLNERVTGFECARRLIAERIDLEKIMEASLLLGESLKIPQLPGFQLAQSKRDLITSFFLRSISYNHVGHATSFNGVEEGFEYDKYDAKSITLLQLTAEKIVIGSARFILDSPEYGLPSEEFSQAVSNQREFGNIAEISRTVVHPNFRGKNNLIFNQFAFASRLAELNGIDRFVYSAQQDPILDLYQRGIADQNIIDWDLPYKEVKGVVNAVSWNPKEFHQSLGKFMARADKIAAKGQNSLEVTVNEQ